MKKYFTISDIHSYYKEAMEALIGKGFDIDNKEHIVIVCGDAFDRGDETIKVFEFLKDMKSQDRLIYIAGNHEDLLFDCMSEISLGKTPGSHHFSNGTVKTICQFTGENEWIVYHPTNDLIQKMFDATQEVRDFIRENTVDYYELGNNIFVHSWIPLKDSSWEHYFRAARYSGYDEAWNVDPKTLSISELILNRDRWKVARWVNPFVQWKDKNYPEDKRIVFGHWHCSWGHSHIDMETPEYPQKNQPLKWEAAWKPWVKENDMVQVVVKNYFNPTEWQGNIAGIAQPVIYRHKTLY